MSSGSYLSIEKLLEKEMLGAKPSTIRNYSVVIRTFINVTGKTSGFTRNDILSFFQRSGEKGWAKGYLRFAYTAIKAYLNAIEEEMPISRRKVPAPKQHELHRPVLTPTQIEKIIKACKNGQIADSLLVAFIAFASIYGFRRTELCQIEIFGQRRIKVITAKTGAPREHKIPPEILPYIRGYIQVSLPRASAYFHEICKLAGLKPIDYGGWHSFRRAVATALINIGVNQQKINFFMAWSPSQSKSLQYYYSPQAAEIDDEIFKVHPFLAMWKDE